MNSYPTVYVDNLFPDIDVHSLCNVMHKFGKIIEAKVNVDGRKNSTGSGYVIFYDYSSAHAVVDNLNMRNTSIAKPLMVKISEKFTNLYVKNFNLDWDNLDLMIHFEKFGKIQHAEVAVQNGESRGFGFVNFVHHENASRAISAMHGKEVDGKCLYVQPHVKKELRDNLKTGSSSTEQNTAVRSNNLKISNLPTDFTEDKLKNLFQGFGTIQSAKMTKNERGEGKGYGFICFKSVDEAKKAAFHMNGYILKSRQLSVSFARGVPAQENYYASQNTAPKTARPYKSNKAYASAGNLLGCTPKELFSYRPSKKY